MGSTMPNPTDKARQLLARALTESFPGADSEFETVAGGFVVAVTSAAFGTPGFSSREAGRKFADVIWRVNTKADEPDRVVVFECKFFSKEHAVYDEKGQLRAQPTKWENGHPVYATTSQDAW